jgi:hypothetical protein
MAEAQNAQQPRRLTMHLRVDEDLLDRIGRAAKQSLRSKHSEVMFRLRRSLEQDSEEAAA